MFLLLRNLSVFTHPKIEMAYCSLPWTNRETMAEKVRVLCRADPEIRANIFKNQEQIQSYQSLIRIFLQ